MSKHELRNVLFARGPSFKEEFESNVPSGNIDLAPTILHILGLQASKNMSGRVLNESLAFNADLEDKNWETELYNAEKDLGDLVYRQQIKINRVDETTYLDYGTNTLGPR